MVTVQCVVRRNTAPPDWVVACNSIMRFLVLSITGWLTAEVTRLTRHLSQLVEQRSHHGKRKLSTTRPPLGRRNIERFEQVIDDVAEVFWLSDVRKGVRQSRL